MRATLPALILCCAAALAGCGSADPATPNSPAATSASASAASSASGPTISPSADATTGCPNPEIGLGNECLGPIEAGTYTTTLFTPTLTYTVPEGWANLEDMPGNFLLLPPGSELGGVNTSTSDFLGVYTSVLAPELCTGKYDTSVEQTYDGLVEWLEANPRIEITNRHDASVGGLDGVVMDIAMKDPKGDGCPDGVWADIYVGGTPTGLVHAVGPDYPLRIYLLRNGDKTLAVELADAPNGGSDHPDWFAAAAPVVDSLAFAHD